MKAAPAKQTGVDLINANFWFEAMENQKERLRALISVLQGILEGSETPPDVRTLLEIAAGICEYHTAWYKLQDCLGKRPTGAKGAGDE